MGSAHEAKEVGGCPPSRQILIGRGAQEYTTIKPRDGGWDSSLTTTRSANSGKVKVERGQGEVPCFGKCEIKLNWNASALISHNEERKKEREKQGA